MLCMAYLLWKGLVGVHSEDQRAYTMQKKGEICVKNYQSQCNFLNISLGYEFRNFGIPY